MRIKVGKVERDRYFREHRITEFDYLPERTYVMDGGVKVIPRSKSSDFEMLFIPREETVKRHLIMRENETFVDIGANVGFYSLMIANKYQNQTVRVISIEAHPENYSALCRNIECNDFGRMIKPINMAISDHKGTISLYERSLDGARIDSILYSVCKDNPYSVLHPICPGDKSLEVECDELDNVLADEYADVMKIDVEGAEVLVLNGATNVIQKLRKIVVEIHGDNLQSVKHLLGTSGFKVETSSEPGGTYVIGSKNMRDNTNSDS